MSFNATAYRVLIASPGDLHDERSVIERVVYEWNDYNAVDDEVVLLPVRWETHSVPEFGDRPQAILNRRIVSGCDILIGAFWTKLGTPTGVSDSGTMEEIEQFLQAGKPVLLYFSSREINPDRVDLDQLKHLRAAKDRLMQRGLVERCVSPEDLRWKLARHLDEQVRRLRASGSHAVAGGKNPAPAVPALKSLEPVQQWTSPTGEKFDSESLGALYEEYWTEFNQVVARSDLGLRPPTPSTRNYARLSLRSSDMRMNAFISVRDRLIGVELVLKHPACDKAIARLRAIRGEIDGAVGQPLEWNEFPGSVRISLSKKGYNIAARPDWPRQQDWLIDKARLFLQVLVTRINDSD